jgi:adenylate kinase family enzyme
MSGLLLQWLNEELDQRGKLCCVVPHSNCERSTDRLSLHCIAAAVLNLEQDLRNGYLLGEVLYRHNQQPNFSQFRNKNDAESKVLNFNLLVPALHSLGVLLDASSAFAIMQGTPGAVATLLYQMRMVLVRRLTLAANTTTPGRLPNVPQRARKPQYDSVTHRHFVSTIRKLMGNVREVNFRVNLARFEAEGHRQEMQATQKQELEVKQEQMYVETIRVLGLQDLAKRKAQSIAREESGASVWLENQERARKRVAAGKRFQANRTATRTAAELAAIETARREVYEGIAACESVKQSQQGDSQQIPAFAIQDGLLNDEHLAANYSEQMQQLHHRKEDQRADARAKRRRQFVTLKEATHDAQHETYVAKLLESSLARKSIAEEAICKHLDTIAKHADVMQEARAFRDEQVRIRAVADAQQALLRDQALFDSAMLLQQQDVAAQVARYTAAVQERVAAVHTRAEKLCAEVLDDVVTLTLEAAQYREYAGYHELNSSIVNNSNNSSDDTIVPTLHWYDMKECFVQGLPLPVIAAATSSTSDNVITDIGTLAVQADSTSTIATASDDSTKAVTQQLDSSEYQQYLRSVNHWKKPTINHNDTTADATTSVTDSLSDDVTTSPLVTATTSHTTAVVAPAHILGETIIEVRLAAEPMAPQQQPPAIPIFGLRICMCGPTFTGKSEQSLRLAERFGLKMISCEDALQAAIEAATQASLRTSHLNRSSSSNDDDNITATTTEAAATTTIQMKLGHTALEYITRGEEVPDTVYAGLIVEAIHSVAAENTAAVTAGGSELWLGWIVEDYPETVSQAAELERLLTGYDANTKVPCRYDRASPLARTAQVETLSTTAITSGVDLMIYLDMQSEVMPIQRCLGRRVDPVAQQDYHCDHDVPPYDIVCKERLTVPYDPANPVPQLAYQLSTHKANAVALRDYLQRFGNERAIKCDTMTADALFATVNATVTELLVSRSATATTDSAQPQTESNTVSNTAVTVDDASIASDANTTTDVNGTVPDNSSSATPAAAVAAPIVPSIDAATADTTTVTTGDALVFATPVLHGVLATAMASHWCIAEQQYESVLKTVFRTLRQQRSTITTHYHQVRYAFKHFLAQADTKQIYLDTYIDMHNALPEAMRFDTNARAELMLRADECRDKLWKDTESRQSNANAVIKAVMEEGTVVTIDILYKLVTI